MAKETTNTKNKPKLANNAIGAQATPVPFSDATKLDIDTTKQLIDTIIDAGIAGGLNITELENFTAMSNSRDQMYQLIDTMAQDSTVSAIIRTYAEDVCEVADNGHIIWCESDDPKISLFINYLLNVMNADKNIYKWAYNLIKYGDVYLRLFRESDYQDPIFKVDRIKTTASAKTQLNESVSVKEDVKVAMHSDTDKYSYYVEMVADPNTMFELVKYGQTSGYIETPNVTKPINFVSSYMGGDNTTALNFSSYRMKTNDVNIYQADDFVHACLDDNFTRYPETVELFKLEDDFKNNANAQTYSVHRGKSMLYDSYKIWREKSLLETAVLLNRLTKSSVIRNIQVEVGDMGKTQTAATLRRVKELFEQKSAYNANTSMGEYNNPGPIENNVYTATHNGQGAITVNAVGGDYDVKNLADLDWWNNRFFAAYGIPKQVFGYCQDDAGFSGGASLSIISSFYAKGVKRVQNALTQALTDAINLFLINRGCRSYLNNFVLKMKAPLSQEEKDYREDFTNRVSAISSTQSLFSDIEAKDRRLEILKVLVKSLNYGDEILQMIDQEIAAVRAAEELAKKEADLAKQASEKEANTENTADLSAADSDLGMSSIATESLQSKKPIDLSITETSFITESDELPTPDELDQNYDFTKNK